MRTGNPDSRGNASLSIDYSCLLRNDTRYTNRTTTFPDHPCPAGMITTLYFPPCWDWTNCTYILLLSRNSIWNR